MKNVHELDSNSEVITSISRLRIACSTSFGISYSVAIRFAIIVITV